MARVGAIELLILLALCGIPLLLALGALIVVVVARGRRIPCPYCAESIRPDAVVCRFCGRDVREFLHSDNDAEEDTDVRHKEQPGEDPGDPVTR